VTVDNLISADVVTADAKLIRANAKEHDDLFWVLRGGGGNFGVVTSFEFNLHALGPEVLSGLVVHPFEKAGELLPEFRRIANEAPDELTIWVVMRKAPPVTTMPIFMDRHDMRDLTAEDVAEAHRKDLEIQDQYGVKYLTY
jgi:FAD/FMN-containing dehydrogenase